jgi:hypothetical protein
MIDVFRIGVSIGMTNDVSPVIGTIQRDLAGLGRTVDRAAAGFGALRLAAMAALGGAGVAWAGVAGARMAGGPGREASAAPAVGAAARAAAVPQMAGRELARAAQGVAAMPLAAAMLPVRNQAAPAVPARAVAARPVAVDLSPVAGRAGRPGVALRGGGEMPVRMAARDLPRGDGVAARVAPVRAVVALPAVALPVAGARAAGAVPAAWALPGPVHEIAAWVRAAGRGARAMSVAREGFAELTARVGALGSVLSRTDWMGMFERVARGLRAVAEAGHGIGDWSGARGVAPGEAQAAHEAPAMLHVHVVNAHEIGSAAGEALNRGLRVPAATMPSLPTPAAGPWAPGLMPALP